MQAIWVEVGPPDLTLPRTTCGTCGWDQVVALPTWLLWPEGVTVMAEPVTACLHCEAVRSTPL